MDVVHQLSVVHGHWPIFTTSLDAAQPCQPLQTQRSLHVGSAHLDVSLTTKWRSVSFRTLRRKLATCNIWYTSKCTEAVEMLREIVRCPCLHGNDSIRLVQPEWDQHNRHGSKADSGFRKHWRLFSCRSVRLEDGPESASHASNMFSLENVWG